MLLVIYVENIDNVSDFGGDEYSEAMDRKYDCWDLLVNVILLKIVVYEESVIKLDFL